MRHIPEPDQVTAERDQREFDETVERNTPYLLTGIAGVAALAAVAMSAVALAQSSHRMTVSGAPVGVTQARVAQAASPAASTTPAPVESLKVIPEYKVGPDGQKHDAFTQTEFHVKVGQPLKLRIDNTDEAPHSITAPGAGVNIIVQPGVHTYTLLVKTAGHYQWFCALQCDEWAMQHIGYMSGYITATD